MHDGKDAIKYRRVWNLDFGRDGGVALRDVDLRGQRGRAERRACLADDYGNRESVRDAATIQGGTSATGLGATDGNRRAEDVSKSVRRALVGAANDDSPVAAGIAEPVAAPTANAGFRDHE